MTTEETEDQQPQEPQELQDQPDSPEPSEQTEEQSADGGPAGELQAILDAAKESRLSPADEDRAIQLLKEAVAAGPKSLPVALDAILALSWGAAVEAVTEAWPETKPAGRARLLGGLAKIDTDASRRIRLSLARGLHAQDADAALKLIESVCEAMGGAQGGSTTKDRQTFASVMLGKAKPWIMNVSMTEMKPAEARAIITPALESCAQAPIFTQIWVLRWVCDSNQFDVLPPEHVDSIAKSINRWQARWRKELRKIIPKLPDSLEAALGGSDPGAISTPARAEAETVSLPTDADAAEEPPSAEEEASAAAPAVSRRSGRDRQQAGFDLNRSLREIEAYCARLRSELQQAQVAVRRREPERQRARPQASASSEDIDELRRYNQQIEEQNEELRRRIEELASDHEDRAAIIEIDDRVKQFKTLLGLKLKEDFVDYSAISRESLNEVVRRHAHEILGRVFSVLETEGVSFDPKA